MFSKKAMFNLNENNRFVMSYNPIDLRKGVDSLCGAVRSCQLDPLNGSVPYAGTNLSFLWKASLLMPLDAKDFKQLLLPFQTIMQNRLLILKIPARKVGYPVEY